MITDPSWLYSTIAQSSAAIVAIIGGFITATVLTLTSEKRNLIHQKEDKETRLKGLKTEENRLSLSYMTIEVENFFSFIEKELKKEDELPPFEEFTQRYPLLTSYLNQAILKREYEKLVNQRLEAEEFIKQHSDLINPSEYILFDEWVKKHKLNIPTDDYTTYSDEYHRLQYKQSTEAKDRQGTPLWMIPPPFQQDTTTLKDTQYELYYREQEDKRLEDVRLRLNSVRQEKRLLEGEVSSLDTRLKTFSYPPNLGGGVAILCYLAAVGILFPIVLIRSELYQDTLKSITIALFSVGIIGIFAYIISLIKRLRSNNAKS